jgi:hypothetical protein
MKIVENSCERLALRLSRFGLSTGVCVLDRKRDATTVMRFALIVPYFRRRVPLSQVRDVTVRRTGEHGGYRTVLKMGLGREIALGEFNKDDALAAAKAIRDFLWSSKGTTSSVL